MHPHQSGHASKYRPSVSIKISFPPWKGEKDHMVSKNRTWIE